MSKGHKSQAKEILMSKTGTIYVTEEKGIIGLQLKA